MCSKIITDMTSTRPLNYYRNNRLLLLAGKSFVYINPVLCLILSSCIVLKHPLGFVTWMV